MTSPIPQSAATATIEAFTGYLQFEGERIEVDFVATRADAIKAFEEAIWAREPKRLDKQESIANSYGCLAFVSSVMVSDSPIELSDDA